MGWAGPDLGGRLRLSESVCLSVALRLSTAVCTIIICVATAPSALSLGPASEAASLTVAVDGATLAASSS